MLIEKICENPQNVVMGASALIGAIAYSGYCIIEAKKKLGKKFKFDMKKIVDTVWQSVLTGIAAGIAIGCSWAGIVISMITAVGVDKIANKFKIGEKQILNLAQLVSGFITKVDKKK